MRESMNLGILVLLGVTAVVLAGIAGFMRSVAHRSSTNVLPDTESASNR